MKTKITKILFALFFICGAGLVQGQNLQVHYDFGKAEDDKTGDNKDREFFTTTLEMFRPDAMGSTFFFVDFDFNKDSDKGQASVSYMEIARNLKLGNLPVQLHLELNDGTATYIKQAWLIGGSYPFKIGNASLTTTVAYKHYERNKEGLDFQFTQVWFIPLLDGKITLSGFLDIWTTDKDKIEVTTNPVTQQKDVKFLGVDGKKVVILTEPQFWYNINDKFSIGTEIELSYNFFTFDEKWKVMPTAAVKWNF